MEPTAKKQRTEDQNVHCRLSYGLNADCLEHIFQYLDTVDLHKVGEMNIVYNQIIKDFVIPKHKVDLKQLFNRDIAGQFFREYGTKIKQFRLFEEYRDDLETSTRQLIQLNQLVNQHCSIDQLRDVRISMVNILNDSNDVERHEKEEIIINLARFKRIETFVFVISKNMHTQITVSLKESLRHLHLCGVDLDPNFDWNKSANLMELNLSNVCGINAGNFINFLRKRPRLKVFRHSLSFEKSRVEKILNSVGKYCGDNVRFFKNFDTDRQKQHSYNFISKLKKVKRVELYATNICCVDLIDPIKRLAENNTIEYLGLFYFDWISEHSENCIFQKQPDNQGLNMKDFTSLKKIRLNYFPNEPNQCGALKLFSLYASPILSKVEFLYLYKSNVYSFIEFMPKLRNLCISQCEYTFDQAAEILSMVGNILDKRRNANSDFIYITAKYQKDFDSFSSHANINSSIKLIGPIKEMQRRSLY